MSGNVDGDLSAELSVFLFDRLGVRTRLDRESTFHISPNILYGHVSFIERLFSGLPVYGEDPGHGPASAPLKPSLHIYLADAIGGFSVIEYPLFIRKMSRLFIRKFGHNNDVSLGPIGQGYLPYKLAGAFLRPVLYFLLYQPPSVIVMFFDLSRVIMGRIGFAAIYRNEYHVVRTVGRGTGHRFPLPDGMPDDPVHQVGEFLAFFVQYLFARVLPVRAAEKRSNNILDGRGFYRLPVKAYAVYQVI